MGRLTIAVAVLVLFVVFYKVPGSKFWAMPVGGGGAVGIRTCVGADALCLAQKARRACTCGLRICWLLLSES